MKGHDMYVPPPFLREVRKALLFALPFLVFEALRVL
jgi:hypothetical protein